MTIPTGTTCTACSMACAARRSASASPSRPSPFSMPAGRTGVTPGSTALAGPDGVFPERDNAVADFESQSGTLTALEDFMADAPDAYALTLLPMFHGLALLHSRSAPGRPG